MLDNIVGRSLMVDRIASMKIQENSGKHSERLCSHVNFQKTYKKNYLKFRLLSQS